MTQHLAALRAEVERLRDEARRWTTVKVGPSSTVTTVGQSSTTWARGEQTAYNRVLDLIDKHAREGR